MKSKFKLIFAIMFTFFMGFTVLTGCEGGAGPRDINFFNNGQIIKTINITELTDKTLEDFTLPQAPLGYEFNGFQTRTGYVLTSENVQDFALNSTETDIYLLWNPIEYSVTWDMGGMGEAPTISSYFVNSNYFVNNPEAEGYYFDGWTYEGCENPIFDLILGDGQTVGNITYYANWVIREDIEYKVESYFESNYYDDEYDYDSDKDQYLYGIYNETVEYEPQNYAYFTINNDLSELSGAVSLEEMLVLKVYYKRNRITLNFNYDNEEGTKEISVRQGLRFTNFKTSPTKEGYTFSCWKELSTGAIYTSSQLYSKEHYKNETYTAIWTPNTHTKYVINVYKEKLDGTFVLDNSESETRYDTTGHPVSVSLDEAIYSHNPYGDFYFVENLSNLSTTVTGDGKASINLYYKLNTYTVTFDLDGGNQIEGDTTPLTQTVKSGTKITPPSVAKPGYRLSYWKDKNGSLETSWVITTNETFTAYWSVAQVDFTVNVYKEKLTGEYELSKTTTVKRYAFNSGNYSYPHVSNSSDYANYTLNKTYTKQQNPESNLYANTMSYTIKPEGTTLNIYYDLNRMTITFDFGCEIEGETNKVYTYKYGQEVPNDIYPQDLERDGYVFDGWDNEIVSPILANQTIKAVWIANPYNITYELGEGVTNNANNKQVYTADDAENTLYYPSKTGYNFVGWTIDEGEEKVKDLKYGDLGNKNVTLYAHFEIIYYTISYDGIDENTTNDNPTQYTVLDSITLKDPVKFGYIFLGWWTYGGYNKPVSIIKGSVGNKTFTAGWEEYEIGEIYVNFGNDASNYVKDTDQENITLEFFGATCVGNDDLPVPVTMTKNYNEEDWLSVGVKSVTFTATKCGKTATKTVEFSVIEKPTITFGKTQFRLDLVNKYYYGYLETALEVTVQGSYPSVYYHFYKDGVEIEDTVPQTGGVYELKIVVIDLADYRVEQTQQIKIYERDLITATYDTTVTEVRVGHLLEDLKVQGFDAAGDPANYITVTDYGTVGTLCTISFTVYDVYNSGKTFTTHAVKVYGAPNITFKKPSHGFVTEDMSLEDLFVATDSFGENLDVTVTTDIDFKALNYVTFTCTATDHLGITATNTVSHLVSMAEFGYAYGDYDKETVVLLSKYLGNNENVVIPEGTLYIAKDIFGDFAPNVKSIVVPNSVLGIISKAFLNCTSIEQLSVPFVGLIGRDDVHIAYYGYTNHTTDLLFGSESDEIPTTLKKFTVTRDLVRYIDHVYNGTYGRYYKTSLGKAVALAEEIVVDVKAKENFDITILSDAVKNNSKLKKLTLPSFVTELPEITNCSKLQTIYPSTNLTSVKLNNCPLLTSAISFADSVTEIPANTINNCNSITNIVLHDNITTIGESAFENCTAIENITLPKNLENIEKNAFKGCTSLKNIAIPEKVTILKESVFQNCTSLESVTFPIALLNIEQYAFDGCTSLKTAILPDNAIVVSAYAFRSTAVENLSINNLMTIDTNAYKYCETIKKVTILPSVTTINASLLSGLKGFGEIQEMYLSKEVTEIQTDSFKNVKVSKVVFDQENTMTKINDYAFRYASSLKQVELSTQIVTIGQFAFYECTSLTTVNLENITTFEQYSFFNCWALENVAFSQNLTTIGYATFSMATLQDNLIIPASVTTLEANAFQYTKIKTVTLPSNLTSINSYLFAGSTLEQVNLENITEIGVGAFSECKNLTSVILTDKLTNVGERAFQYCEMLETIVIPDSVNSLGKYAFQYCTSLKNVTLPTSSGEGITLAYTFAYCSALENITIPANVVLIDEAFGHCDNLKQITFTESTEIANLCILYNFEYLQLEKVVVPSIDVWFGMTFAKQQANPIMHGAKLYIGNEIFDYDFTGVTNISDYAFAGADIETLIIPSTVTSIGKSAFSNCVNLKSVDIKAVVDTLDTTFKGCSALTDIVLAEGITTLNNTFQDCISLVDVVLPNSITTLVSTFSGCTSLKTCNLPTNFDGLLSSYVFVDCSALTNFTLPEGLTLVPDGMFSGTSLAEISIPSTVTTIGNYAFYGTSITQVTIPSGVTTLNYYSFAECKNLESATFLGKITKSVTNSATNATNRYFYNCTSLASVTFAEGTTTIVEGMFYGCTSLKQITLPESLTSVNFEAFAYSGLESITIPSKVTSIGSYVFSHCASLSKIIILGDAYINSYAFEYCTALTKASDIEYNENIDTIKEGAFKGCSNLTEAPLPAKLRYFANNLFEDCTSLEILYIPYDGQETFSLAGTYGLKNCYNLKEIRFAEGHLKLEIDIERIYRDSTNNMTVEYVYLPSTLKNLPTIYVNYRFSLNNLVFHKDTVLEETSVAYYTFDNDLLLENELYIPEGVIAIEANGLSNFTGLDKISLPSTVQTIDGTAFANITAKIEWRNPTITTISTNSFKNYLGSSFDMPKSVTTVETNAFYNAYNLLTINAYSVSDWAKINFADAGSNPLSKGAKLYVDDKLITEVRIESQVGDYAFAGYKELTTAYLVSGSYSVGEGAFSDCTSLETILLNCMYFWAIEPAYTFSNCPIKTFFFGGSEQEYTENADYIANMSISASKVYYYSETRPTENEGNYFTYSNGIPTKWTEIPVIEE